MKRYSDLGHEELVALTDEAVEQFIAIEIAHEGIMPISCPVVPSLEAEGIVRSSTAYEVGGILFKNEKDALSVARLEQFESNYDYNIGYDYKWLNPVTERAINKKDFYLQEDVVRIKEILQRNKIKREEYDRAKSTYDKFLSATGKIRDAVYSARNEALNFQKKVDDAKAILEQYRKLAAGDEAVAIGFFKNTYKSREDLIKKVLGE
jgi:hypothetical protein